MKKQSNKLKMREKIALACFMEAVPYLIRLWRERSPDTTFDEFCQKAYDEGKARQNKKK